MKLIQSAHIYAANHETFEQIPRVEPYLYMYLSHTLIAALITENDASIYFSICQLFFRKQRMPGAH